MKLPLWIIAACVVVLGFAAWVGCTGVQPVPPQNPTRFMLSIVDREGHVIARQSFGDANRGQTILLTDTQSDMHRTMDMDTALGWCHWWAGK